MQIQIEHIKISELTEAEYNPRKLSAKQHADIRKSLETFGFVDPVIVNKNPERLNVIIGGHQRVKVWRDMGNDTVPAVFIDLPIDKEKELNIRLNKNTGEWDWDVLRVKFGDIDLEGLGFESLHFPEDVIPKSEDKQKKENKENKGLLKDSVECPHCGKFVEIGIKAKGGS